MRRYTFLPLLILFFLVGCAGQPPLLKETQSGMAEGVFAEASLEDVRGKLIGSCTQHGRQVRKASQNLVVCSNRVEGTGGMLAQALIGNSYSTPPESVAQFTLYQSGRDVMVAGALWLETQMAFGQMKKVPLDSPENINSLQQVLFDLGAY